MDKRDGYRTQDGCHNCDTVHVSCDWDGICEYWCAYGKDIDCSANRFEDSLPELSECEVVPYGICNDYTQAARSNE